MKTLQHQMNFDPLEWTGIANIEAEKMDIKCSCRPRSVSDFNLKSCDDSIPWPTFHRALFQPLHIKTVLFKQTQISCTGGRLWQKPHRYLVYLIFRLDLIEASVYVRFVRFRALCSYETCQEENGILSKELFFWEFFFSSAWH